MKLAAVNSAKKDSFTIFAMTNSSLSALFEAAFSSFDAITF